ncbi:hypothetical protein CKU38_00689 [Xanthomonas citri pv. fuscans]|nr:hypothetical protein CKU38_00689 [Xanthomonas citri pv. fuscans]
MRRWKWRASMHHGGTASSLPEGMDGNGNGTSLPHHPRSATPRRRSAPGRDGVSPGKPCRARVRSYDGGCRHDAAMEAAGGRCNALRCHYGCAGGAAFALAIISATEAVVIG